MGRPIGSNYVTEVEIGYGGYGTVWRALDRQSGEQVAIKILNPEHTSDPDVVSRFLRERSVLLRLRHPNLVRLRDVVFEADTLALVMDLVDGPNLDEYLRKRGKLPPAEAAGLVAQVTEALVVVHAAGVVHRDVKPSNILLAPLTTDPNAETAVVSVAGGGAWPVRPRPGAAVGGLCPRLADFGVARLTDGSQVTKSNELVGTLAYLSPECLRGDPVTPAADIYALGIVAYQLLSGRPPFGGDTQYAVVQRHLHEMPARPDGVPDGMWNLVAACLDKDPRRRLPTADLAGRLRRVAEVLGAAAPVGWNGADTQVFNESLAARTVLIPVEAHRAALAAAGVDGRATTLFAPESGAPTTPVTPPEPVRPPSPTRQYTRQFQEEDLAAVPVRPGWQDGGAGRYAPPGQPYPPPPYPREWSPATPQGPPAPAYPPQPAYPQPAYPQPAYPQRPAYPPPEAPPAQRPARRPRPRIRWWRFPGSGCLLRLVVLAVLLLLVWYVLGGEQAWHSVNNWWHSVNNWWHSVQRLYKDISSLKVF